MAILSRRATEFGDEDVKLLDEMLKKFYELKGSSGLPDYSPNYVAYTPVLALALLGSQKRLERLTWVLAGLTITLAILAGISIWIIVR